MCSPDPPTDDLPAKVGVLVVGAGPTGLGAATRLHQHGRTDWLLVEAAPEPGGLACTATTPQGFLFDMGGHVIFSHYAYFDDLLNAALGGAGDPHWNTLRREAFVWIRGRWVPYPLQNNLAALPADDAAACLAGAAAAAVADARAPAPPATFDDWILRGLGEGVANLFMRPYNFKVWACPPSEMGCGWLGERVARIDLPRAIADVARGDAHRPTDTGWGPNAVFRFPAAGGTGAIWRGVARLLPAARQRYGVAVAAIDADARVATLADGRRLAYDAMITSAPLDATLAAAGRGDLGDGLVRSATHVVGVGLRGACPHPTKCWLYFPGDECPFYRATVFSNYAKANCPPAGAALPTLCRADGRAADDGGGPRPGPYWSLMFEVSESAAHKPVDAAPVPLGGGAWPAVVADALRGAVATGLLPPAAPVVSLFHRRLEHGYPTPSLGRDGALARALPWLKGKRIWSRGRFGAWKYEVANQDHALMQGVEAVDNVLFGAREVTVEAPGVVNAGRSEEPVYRAKGGCGAVG